MSKHQYALRYGGKTLGVKDSAQLARLIKGGKITLDSQVFILAEKRWLRISELSEFSKAKGDAFEDGDRIEVEAVISGNEGYHLSPTAELEAAEYLGDDATTTAEFVALINEIEVPASSRTESLSKSQGSAFDIDSGRTIHKIPQVSRGGHSPRLTDTQVAAKVPNPESSGKTAAFVFALVIFIVGLLLGLAGATFLANNPSLNSDRAMLQADSFARETNAE